jgi:hypothetical protein
MYSSVFYLSLSVPIVSEFWGRQTSPSLRLLWDRPGGGEGGGGVPFVGSRCVAALNEDVEDLVRAIVKS